MNRPAFIIIHTTDSRGATMREIDEDHRKHRKFSMIGYHALVLNGRRYWHGGMYRAEEDGVIKRGRSEEMIGAHCLGMNARSLSLAFVGGRVKRDGVEEIAPVTERQAEAGLRLVREWMARYSIPVERVLGHREVEGTGPDKAHCPTLDMDAFRALLRDGQINL